MNLDDIIRVKEQNPDDVIGVSFSNCGKHPPELLQLLLFTARVVLFMMSNMNLMCKIGGVLL